MTTRGGRPGEGPEHVAATLQRRDHREPPLEADHMIRRRPHVLLGLPLHVRPRLLERRRLPQRKDSPQRDVVRGEERARAYAPHRAPYAARKHQRLRHAAC